VLNHPTFDKLKQLRLSAMARALEEQKAMPQVLDLSFEERLALLVDRELDERENRRQVLRLKNAKLRQQASMEDLDYRHHRGLDKSVLLHLSGCSWINKCQNILITGPTGVGKSYLACALAHKACLSGHNVLYHRLPRLLEEISLSRGDGRYLKLMKTLTKAELLVLDDWGLSKLTREQQSDLLELFDDRHHSASTIITSQLPIEHWHQMMPDPTLADAILDRLVHNAHRIEMQGDSMRKKQADLTQSGHLRI
jgi:DNA replication protein DnaC